MLEFLSFISYLITLYTYIVIAGVILSWLMAFDVVNAYNPIVRAIWQGLNAVTEPLLRRSGNVCRTWAASIFRRSSCCSPAYFVQSVVLPNIAKLVI